MEDDIHTEVKAHRKGDTKGHEHGCNVGLKSNEAQVEDLLLEDEVISNEVNPKS